MQRHEQSALHESFKSIKWVGMPRNTTCYCIIGALWVHMLRKRRVRSLFDTVFSLPFLQFVPFLAKAHDEMMGF